MKEALFYAKIKGKTLQCKLCPNFCVLKKNEIGKCKSRKNINGKLFSLTYGKPAALHIDPIEKKPIFHVLPGTYSYSIGTTGCQLSCKFCQNFELSQASAEEKEISYIEPSEIVNWAIRTGCKSISYTYTDPVAFYEYALDIAKIAREHGLKNIIVSNGYINPAPLKELCKYVDAANIDLKSMNNKFYKDTCSGSLKPVLKSLKVLKKEKVWLEITNLVIPTLNDSQKEIEALAKWVSKNLGRDQVIHFSRYYPMYQMNIPPTPETTLQKAYSTAKKYLDYVYTGNIANGKEDTICPKCKSLLIKRHGFSIIENNIKDNKCYKCNNPIPGLWK